MFRNMPHCRRLVAASLAISMSFAGTLLPLTAVAGNAVQASTSAEGMTPCCCGTADASCCGMACCVPGSPATPRVPSPAPPLEEHQPIYSGFAWAGASALYIGGKSLPRSRHAQIACETPSEVSLQSLQVRLDV